MNKPTGYDEAKASGDYIAPELGGHYCKIIQVSEAKTKTGKDQIVVLLDFDQNDKQAGLFTTSFNNDQRPQGEKKWPFAGSKWIMVNDYNDDQKTSRNFKTFCSCVEKSNNYTITWGGADWAKQFKGKKIGAVYGEEESEYNGKTYMRSQLRYFCGIDAVANARIPNPKYLDQGGAITPANASTNTDGFMSIPDGVDEEIPF